MATDVKTISIEPQWPNTLRWTARAVIQHGFKWGAHEPIISLMEMAIKVHNDDPATFRRIIAEIENDYAIRELAAAIVVGPTLEEVNAKNRS